MSAPAVSIVCPAYNARRTVRATLRSVLDQTMGDFELIVVDDGSADETPEIVEGFAREDDRVQLIRQENAGTAGARNTGVAAARGARIAIIDNDDLWMPSYLDRVCAALDANPTTGLAHTDAWILDDRTGMVHRKTAVEWLPARPTVMDADRLRLELLRGNFIMASTVTMTREAVEAAGEFNTAPDFLGSDDWDMWLRIAEAGFGAVRPPGVLGVYRERPDSVSRNHLLMMRSSNAVAKSALARDPAGADVAAELIRYTDRELAHGRRRGPGPHNIVWMRRRVGAGYRRLMRRQNWWAPPLPLREMLGRIEPERASLSRA